MLNLNQLDSAKDFCIYLKGYLDAVGHNGLAASEIKQISEKLESLFTRPGTPTNLCIDPTYGGEGVQDALNNLHSGNVARPFSDLTEGLSPERRERVEQHKEHLRQLFRP